MTLLISHSFVSGVADDPAAAAAGEVVPSNWNAAHSLTGLGTGVETALGVNVGSAGAVVTFNGALGTPSSGVATNLTGTAAGLTAGTASAVALGGITGLGANVGTALGIAVGSAGAPVTNGGALGTPSSGTLTNCTGLPVAGVTGALGYVVPFASTIGNPADSTTYFIGMIAALTTVTATGLLRVTIPKAGTVKRIDLKVGVGGTLGTGEAITFNFRLNNTTDTLITNAAVASALVQDYTAAVSIAVVAGDYFEIKMATPAWATNPTSTLVTGSIYIE